ncbi:hypothetical protein ACWD7C_18085 [Streptomyces sp. NPDC005134]|uniref:hypothetical protein n=1 Tax=Streptomyces sp. NPDC005098 TaxID=3154560 RepID=UPI00339EE567
MSHPAAAARRTRDSSPPTPVDTAQEKTSHDRPPRRLRDVPVWRESEAYTPLERDVRGYAEAMSLTPPEVGDELVDLPRTALGEKAPVELTTMVAVKHMRSRTIAHSA